MMSISIVALPLLIDPDWERFGCDIVDWDMLLMTLCADPVDILFAPVVALVFAFALGIAFVCAVEAVWCAVC